MNPIQAGTNESPLQLLLSRCGSQGSVGETPTDTTGTVALSILTR